jgi:N-acyl-D-aspartate/D-glutamate deacylase
VREKVIGSVDRKATPEEIAQMKELVRQGMRDGAFGLSTGLFYVPGTFTPTEEVIELARWRARWAGSTPRTCARRPGRSSTACARRSRSARRALCRRR